MIVCTSKELSKLLRNHLKWFVRCLSCVGQAFSIKAKEFIFFFSQNRQYFSLIAIIRILSANKYRKAQGLACCRCLISVSLLCNCGTSNQTETLMLETDLI